MRLSIRCFPAAVLGLTIAFPCGCGTSDSANDALASTESRESPNDENSETNPPSVTPDAVVSDTNDGELSATSTDETEADVGTHLDGEPPGELESDAGDRDTDSSDVDVGTDLNGDGPSRESDRGNPTNQTTGADASAPQQPARSNDPCRHPEECTNGGDVNDVWNVMTCFAPWQPRPVGVYLEAGCQNRGCPDGMLCRDDGNCEAIACDSAEDCASDFECSSVGTCQRIACTTDDDCSAYCVNGGCSQTLGICDYQTAA